MSVRRKKTGLLIGWHRSFTMARWRKGKENRHTVLDSRVVLTKMKLLTNFNERTVSLTEHPNDGSAVTASHADILDPVRIAQVDSHHKDDGSVESRVESSSDYLSEMFSASQLTRLYKFESEDSGVELPSGANSPSTPTGSEHSFMVHSRESSCHSSNLHSNPNTLPDLSTHGQCCEVNQDVLTVHDVLTPSHQLSSSTERVDLRISEELDKEHCRDSGIHPQEDTCEVDLTKTGPESDDMTTVCKSTSERRGTHDSLEEYMEQCCRVSQTRQSIRSSLGSGLTYLEHICQLLEKIGQLQEVNLQLQRKICGLQKDGQRATTKEQEFFQQHCRCGAAALAFPGCEFLSPTPSDLSTIPEVTWNPLFPRKDMSLSPLSLWRRSLNRRSYTEGHNHFLCDTSDGISIPGFRSENYAWSRVKDLVKRNKVKDAVGMTPPALKMSCPQLYRP